MDPCLYKLLVLLQPILTPATYTQIDQVDTARRIAAAAAAEDAAEDWAERCEIHGLDLRDVVGLSDFIQGMLRRYDRVVSPAISVGIGFWFVFSASLLR